MRLHGRWVIPLVVILAVIFGLLHRVPEQNNFEESRILLDTVVNIRLFNSTNGENLEKAFEYIDEWNNRVNRHSDSSEITIINKANSGTPAASLAVPKDIWELIDKSVRYAALSEGAFDPSIAPLIDLWGIGTENARIPSSLEIQKALSRVDYRQLHLDKSSRSISFSQPNMALDLGGIAKGWIADKTTDYLRKAGESHFLLDLGGNIRVSGGKGDGSPYRIGIQNPFAVRGHYLGVFTIEDGSLVSSGVYERFFELDGKKYHHILSTEDGFPIKNELVSVTVLSANATDGDALSTALFAMGLDKGMQLVNSLDKVEAAFVTKGQEIILSPGSAEKFEISDPEFQIIEDY